MKTRLLAHGVVGTALVALLVSVVGAGPQTNATATEYSRAVAASEFNPVAEIAAVAESDLCASAVSCFTAPANDHSISSFTAGPGRTRLSLHLATRGSEGQNATACWSAGGVDQDVWYKFVADQTGTWTISLCATEAEFDSRLVVYELAPNEPPTAPVACADDSCGEHASVSFYAELGESFYVQVGAADSPGDVDAIMDIAVE